MPIERNRPSRIREDALSGVIYAAIVAMWAVVLVPMWLRRHDTSVESRSVDRFSSAMRVLSPRSKPTGDRRYVVMPRRADRLDVHVSGASPVGRSRSRSVAARRPATAGRAQLLARRRRLVVGLAGLAFLTFVLAVAGVLGWTLQLLTDVALVGYVVHLRGEAKRAAAVSRQRRRATVANPHYRSVGVFADDEWDAEQYDDGSAWGSADRDGLPSDGESFVPWQEDDVAETGTDGRWDPVPVPRPTYQLKPPAPPRAPAPDEPYGDADGIASSYDDRPAAQPAAAEVDADDWDEIDDILARRRAVND